MKIKPHVKVIAGPLPLAPLVDVVFLLLIFFMISSSLVFWPGTKVETRVQLPPSRTSSMSAADKLVITITLPPTPEAGWSGATDEMPTELLFFNDNPVQWQDLERDLKEMVRRSQLASVRRTAQDETGPVTRSPLVVLRADRRIPYGKVVEVMSLARSLGLGVYLVTDSEADLRRRRILSEDGN